MISESVVQNLRERIQNYMGKNRLSHTLGVEEMAAYLGNVFLPDEVYELRCCALLHDIAKELSEGEQLDLIQSYGVHVTDEDIETTSALHSFAAVGLIKRDFPEFANKKILDAVYFHTLGDAGMGLFSEIIFISDYIERGRTYPSCISVRDELIQGLKSTTDFSEKIKLLHRAVIASIDFTVESLDMRGKSVNSRTLLTRDAFLSLI